MVVAGHGEQRLLVSQAARRVCARRVAASWGRYADTVSAATGRVLLDPSPRGRRHQRAAPLMFRGASVARHTTYCESTHGQDLAGATRPWEGDSSDEAEPGRDAGDAGGQCRHHAKYALPHRARGGQSNVGDGARNCGGTRCLRFYIGESRREAGRRLVEPAVRRAQLGDRLIERNRDRALVK